MPTAPIHHHLNLAGQNVLTFASWVLTFVLLGVAVMLSRKERTPFYVLVVLAAMVGAFGEALYDTAFSLYFYSTPHLQSFYTAFGVPQPVWTHSGYAILYALPALFIAQKVWQGRLTRSSLYAWAGVELAMSCVFEITGINIGTYTYWGPHVLRILHYPIVIGVLEAAQVMCFSIAASQLRHRATSDWGLLGLFAIFPVTMFGANFGAGCAVIIAIHLQHHSTALITLGTLVSIGCAGALIRFAADLIPPPGRARAAAPAPAASSSRLASAR